MSALWGIDLGGTKIEGVILKSAQNPETVARLRVPTEKDKGYEHIISQIGKTVDLLREETGLEPKVIGMGTPGSIDPPTQKMKNSNTTVLNRQPFKKDIEDRLGLKFVIANDANCFAVAETRMGIVKEKLDDAQMVFGVIMGTGVGGGIIYQGEVWNGRQGIGGEWGHSYLDDSGGPCYCGNTGCVETILSGPHTEQYYQKIAGTERKLREIIERHKKGIDPHATETVERLLHFFGKGMANILNILDPDAVVLGGGLGNIDLLYTDGVEKVKEFVFNPRLDTPFLKPALGDSAGVFGAAFLTSRFI
ncbi:MAG TPA: ROK family protein [Saprospiraceae bacterium]|nr:ROK family protein [Saprospiraceae bacterium]